METKKLSLYQRLGSNLIDKGKWFLNRATPIKKTVFTGATIQRAIGQQAGINPVLYDQKYYTTDIETWKTIIANDWTNKKKWTEDYYDCWIPSDLSFAFGLFCSDGSCSLNKMGTFSGASWRIVNSSLEYLKRAKRGLEAEYPELTFKINLYDSYKKGTPTNYGLRKKDLYSLDVYKNKTKMKFKKRDGSPIIKSRGHFIKMFRELFYRSGQKQVPSPIFDHFPDVSKAFMDGMFAGDGTKNDKKRKQITIDRNNPNLAFDLEEIADCLGWENKTKLYDKQISFFYKEGGTPVSCHCDNFAGSFTAYCADIYGLNSAGRFTVELRDPKTKKHIGYHRAVIIIDDKLQCYLLESQTDKIVKIEQGKNPVIGNWEYVVNYISVN